MGIYVDKTAARFEDAMEFLKMFLQFFGSGGDIPGGKGDGHQVKGIVKEWQLACLSHQEEYSPPFRSLPCHL